jgi:hypothetical protein
MDLPLVLISPSIKPPEYLPWQNDIGRILRKHGTFPKDSELAQRAQSTTNGYHAILTVLSNTHPAFITQPITLAMNWPKQREQQSLFDFHTDFMDYIRLRAIFMGGSVNLTSSNMVDRFIHNCRHSTYLLQISRFDRQDPQKASKFQPSTLAITLNTYLSNPDSPTKRTPCKPPYKAPYKPMVPYKTPYQKPPYQSSNDGKAPTPYFKHISQILTDHGPTDSSPDAPTIDTYMDYGVAQIQTTPDLTIHPCLLCREPHRFNTCPLLRGEEFKSTFIIKLLACISRELRNGKQRGTGTASRISQVLADITSDSTANPPDHNGSSDNPPQPLTFLLRIFFRAEFPVSLSQPI